MAKSKKYPQLSPSTVRELRRLNDMLNRLDEVGLPDMERRYKDAIIECWNTGDAVIEAVCHKLLNAVPSTDSDDGELWRQERRWLEGVCA